MRINKEKVNQSKKIKHQKAGVTMIRKIIHIDQELCNGCGQCVEACHEGAIQLVNGKAQLVRDDYCDGLGDCLPVCPTNAISFEEREAAPYDAVAVAQKQPEPLACGCPGTASRKLERKPSTAQITVPSKPMESRLSQWPVQIKLAPVNAPYFQGASLLIAADCTAYAYGNFHNDFIKNKITLIGCPKLDSVDYAEKLTAILERNDIKDITVVRMEVPCCSGIVNAVITALKTSGKFIPWQVVTISTNGEILE